MREERQRAVPVLPRILHQGQEAEAEQEHRHVSAQERQGMTVDSISQTLPGRGCLPRVRSHERKGADVRCHKEGRTGVVRLQRLTDIRVVKVVAVTPVPRRGQQEQSEEVKYCLRESRLTQKGPVHEVVVQDERPYQQESGQNWILAGMPAPEEQEGSPVDKRQFEKFHGEPSVHP